MAGTASIHGSISEDHTEFLLHSYRRIRQTVSERSSDATTLPDPAELAHAIAALPHAGNTDFLSPRGAPAALEHILSALAPGLNNQNLSGRYYGFVTGGVLPVAEAADNVVTALDQNVQVNMPGHSAAPAVEDAALSMLVALLELGPDADWPARTFTTGATGSNVLGLACGREAVVARRAEGVSVAEVGFLAACQVAGIKGIQVLTSMGHASLSKAASIVGLGHHAVKELPASPEEPWRLDLDAVERELAREGVASIVAVSAGEVNTGRFATNALDMPKLRSLADRYGAWVHVDGAFGIFARALPKTDEFLNLHANVAGLELADSIAADGHKILNVPYDAGIFLCRDASIPSQVFQNPNAAYLATPSRAGGAIIHSALNVGLENSRRFRALPVYAVLLSEGRQGIASMVARMVALARELAAYIRASEDYEWLPDKDAPLENSFMVVLFRAMDPALNEVLVDRINATRKIFVSGTKWKGQKACRIAVSNWRADAAKDLPIVQEVLTSVAQQQ
ncbi:pyridoxal phosphate-dependent transferase [Immersiella caudata]|uniref:Pyridoxal phosphate-dependent transferase n=1 Tax=Immersiella caudata TaxID=314043 RepID=A0AA39WF22_9PEZI|nr:pyridoxal phosphate-dependent transferase [Immersiella caudata]